jgi:putative membrane protein
MYRHGSMLIIAAFALVTGFSPAPEPPNPQTGTIEYVEFLEASLAHAQSQLELAELAQQKSKTPALEAYARRVATQRAALIDQLNAAAKASGVDAQADTGHDPIIDTFKPLNGEAFERAYIAAEQEDEQNALDEFQFAADHLTDPDLKQLATDEVAELQRDIADAQSIVRNLPFEDESTSDASSMVISPRRRR